ncbi:unnamed protein product [Urochloa humidicola]
MRKVPNRRRRPDPVAQTPIGDLCLQLRPSLHAIPLVECRSWPSVPPAAGSCRRLARRRSRPCPHAAQPYRHRRLWRQPWSAPTSPARLDLPCSSPASRLFNPASPPTTAPTGAAGRVTAKSRDPAPLCIADGRCRAPPTLVLAAAHRTTPTRRAVAARLASSGPAGRRPSRAPFRCSGRGSRCWRPLPGHPPPEERGTLGEERDGLV